MAETSIWLASNLTDNPGLRYTTSGTARATFWVAVSGRGSRSRRSSP
jgi:single-stranded DNA-binding protein